MKILIVSPVSQHAIDALGHDHEVVCAINASEDEICRKIVGCEALIFRSGPNISEKVLRCAPDLSLIIRAGSGLDNLAVDYVEQNKIALYRVEKPGARAVAELTFALMLSLARQVRFADRTLRQGRWAKHEITGYLLHGKVLAIVGPGNIGSTAEPILDRMTRFEFKPDGSCRRNGDFIFRTVSEDPALDASFFTVRIYGATGHNEIFERQRLE